MVQTFVLDEAARRCLDTAQTTAVTVEEIDCVDGANMYALWVGERRTGWLLRQKSLTQCPRSVARRGAIRRTPVLANRLVRVIVAATAGEAFGRCVRSF
ncbi:hypothetical protein ABZV93_08130 [Actinopolymorpha sp. NPDC004070]|uniref:hypothetical protein n=1 Tax=Actinopolymorpha sp. NPDC004070 TaxID=3154548 RepID=UPI0033A3E238